MKKPFAVVAHDAGGAEVLSSFVRREKLDCWFALAGPARAIFERKLGPIGNLPLEEAVGGATELLCGTSWQSDLEYNAIALARTQAKRSTAFIDHWVNYRERFIRNGKISLPDEICVGDAIAEKLARASFPATSIRLVNNPYFEDIRRDLAALPPLPPADSKRLSILYVCEPIREHAARAHGDERYWGYVEEDALRYFLSHVAVLGSPVSRLRIRPHPSEPAGKYGWAANEFDLPIVPGGVAPLLAEIAESDIVVGCGSMAMVVGLLAGKRVISCIPPGGKTAELPQPEIERLRDLQKPPIPLPEPK